MDNHQKNKAGSEERNCCYRCGGIPFGIYKGRDYALCLNCGNRIQYDSLPLGNPADERQGN